jgi:hypothetical protein
MPSFYASIFSRFVANLCIFPFWMHDFHRLQTRPCASAPARLYPTQVERLRSQAMWNITILSALSLFIFVLHQILTKLLTEARYPRLLRRRVASGLPTSDVIPRRHLLNPIAKKAHVGDLDTALPRWTYCTRDLKSNSRIA